jgi:hypothetical protein
MTNIADLDIDTLSLIAAFLDPEDIIALSLTCSRLRRDLPRFVSGLRAENPEDVIWTLPHIRRNAHGSRRLVVMPVAVRLRSKLSDRICYAEVRWNRAGDRLNIVSFIEGIWLGL